MDFAWPDLCASTRDRRTLVIGLGGGADVITAWAVAALLDPGARGSVRVGNTKSFLDPDLAPVSPHIGAVPAGPAPARASTTLDRLVPAPADARPLVFAVARGAPLEPIVDEVRALGVDAAIGVDTGGDVLVRRGPHPRGRDQRMLDVLVRSGLPTTLLVVGLGSDGQTPADRLADALADARNGRLVGPYLGAATVEPLLPVYRTFAAAMEDHRTPRLVTAAWDDQGTDPVEVPRGARPRIPRGWLLSVEAFAASGA